MNTNLAHNNEKLEGIQTILDGSKISRYATQNLLSLRKKFLLSSVNSEYDDLAKFAGDTDSHLFGEELEDSLKKAKEKHYSLQALKPKINYPHSSQMLNSYEFSNCDRPTKRPMAGHKGTPLHDSLSTWALLKKQPLSRRSQYKNHHKHGRN